MNLCVPGVKVNIGCRIYILEEVIEAVMISYHITK